MIKLRKETLCIRIKKLREESGIKPKDFISRSGIPQQTLSKIETGEGTPTLEQLVNIASLCGVTVDYILHGQDKIESYIDDLFEIKFGKQFEAKKIASAS